MAAKKLSFAVISDSHLRPDAFDLSYWNKRLYEHAHEMLAAAVEEINSHSADFVVHCGDLTGRSHKVSFQRAAEILSDLKCPFYFVPGNHDTYYPNLRELAAELFQYTSPTLYRAVECGGWRVLLIDSAYWWYQDGSVKGHYNLDNRAEVTAIGVPDFELDWIRQELERDPTTPTVCFTHLSMAMRPEYPVGTLARGKPVLERPVRINSYAERPWGQTLLQILKSAPGVKALFYGHMHFHDTLVEDGLLYCQTGSLIEYPNEPRFVQIDDQCMRVGTLPLCDGKYAELSYLPEWNNRWVEGRPIDRDRSFPIGSKIH